MSTPLLQLRDLRVRHPAAAAGRWALDGVGLSVAAGERVAVIGASGSGKTSLLLAMALALRPDAGSLELFGVSPWTLPRRHLAALRRRICLAPQSPPLPPRLRVVTAVLAAKLPHLGLATSLRMLWSPSPLEVAEASEVLGRLDMQAQVFERVDRLSGGERQRVGLARALLARADLLLIDEPLSALDPARAAQAVQALCDAAQRSGAALVATLHQVPVALGHFSRIVGLESGRVVLDATPDRVDAATLQRLYAGGAAPADVTPAGVVTAAADAMPEAFR